MPGDENPENVSGIIEDIPSEVPVESLTTDKPENFIPTKVVIDKNAGPTDVIRKYPEGTLFELEEALCKSDDESGLIVTDDETSDNDSEEATEPVNSQPVKEAELITLEDDDEAPVLVCKVTKFSNASSQTDVVHEVNPKKRKGGAIPNRPSKKSKVTSTPCGNKYNDMSSAQLWMAPGTLDVFAKLC